LGALACLGLAQLLRLFRGSLGMGACYYTGG
jgi:hypothetical protein